LFDVAMLVIYLHGIENGSDGDLIKLPVRYSVPRSADFIPGFRITAARPSRSQWSAWTDGDDLDRELSYDTKAH